MVYASDDRREQLANWILDLVEILRAKGGSTWRVLVQTVSGKTAAISLDGTGLRLRAFGGSELQVQVEEIEASEALNFRSDAETLRDVIAGRLSLDAAVTAGNIYVRGDLEDVRGIYAIAMEIIADSPISAQLQRLWEEFDESWPRPASPPSCRALEQQKPPYGYLVNQVPEDVLRTDVGE
ncbi:hypothetical protein [Kamptonema formosum]|uniref:hypothetical protein n=1 Tax=Kamptonema formosum TaxID=331992 RepID=UPI000345728A|nr:hypothetical protein [Oscillatoria sp. PCC 10802]